LEEKSKTELNKMIDFLKKNPTIKIEISAHTDNVGKPSSNLELSQKRAQSVVDFLNKQGIDIKRLVPKGYGETMPVKENDNEENRALNRRIEFKIL
jgi:outer membrane protein OmpA-like peptidoglycan-associated protein